MNDGAADVLDKSGFPDQARILRSLRGLDLRASNEIGINSCDLEKIFCTLVSVVDCLDLFRTKQVMSELDLKELVNDYFLD